MGNIHLTYGQWLTVLWAIETQFDHLEGIYKGLLKDAAPVEDISAIASELVQLKEIRAIIKEAI